MKPLSNLVVLVAGASRGCGKGVALVLGERGATVYVTGHSVRGTPTTMGRPGTSGTGTGPGRRADLGLDTSGILGHL